MEFNFLFYEIQNLATIYIYDIYDLTTLFYYKEQYNTKEA